MKLFLNSLFVYSLCRVSYGIDALPDQGKLIFRCVRSSGDSVPLSFDTDSSKRLNAQEVLDMYESLVEKGLIKAVHTEGLSSILVSDSICGVDGKRGRLSVPAAIYQVGAAMFAVSHIGPKALFYKEHDAFGLHTLSSLWTLASEVVLLSAEEQEALIGSNFGCYEDSENLMSTSRIGDGWEISLESVGVLSHSGFSLLSSSSILGRLSLRTDGIVLPALMWEAFRNALWEQSGIESSGGDGLEILNCVTSEEGVLFPGIPELVVTLAGQEGYGVQLSGSHLTEIFDTTRCRVKIYKNPNPFANEVVLGVPFFASGYVQLGRTGKLTVCPAEQYHATDPAFSLSVRERDRVRAKNLPSVTPIPLQTKHATDDSSNGLWIGVTIGGFGAIVLVTIFMIFRAKRQKAAAAVHLGLRASDCPHRALSSAVSVDGSQTAV